MKTTILSVTFSLFLALGCGKKDGAPKIQLEPKPIQKVETQRTSEPKAVSLTSEESAGVIEETIRGKINKPTGKLTEVDYEKVTDIILRNNELTDISSLIVLKKLEWLNLENNKISDLKPLARLTEMKSLFLVKNPKLMEAEIDKLQKALPRCRIQNSFKNTPRAKAAIERAIRRAAKKPTGELTQADLEKVEQLANFSETITDLKPFAKLSNLWNLQLHSNNITDLKPLEGLKKMKFLMLVNNPYLTKAEIDRFQAVMPNLEILHDFNRSY
jgi:hypothetical protein